MVSGLGTWKIGKVQSPEWMPNVEEGEFYFGNAEARRKESIGPGRVWTSQRGPGTIQIPRVLPPAPSKQMKHLVRSIFSWRGTWIRKG